MDAPILYAYAPGTGERLGSFRADPDPEGGGWLVPAFATATVPPAVSPGTAAVFVAGAWSLVPNHRGETWYGADGSACIVVQLGDPASFTPPLSAEPPPPPPVDLNAYASTAHVARRDGGVTIAGMPVKTDSESRGLITGAYSLSEVKPDATIDFKTAGGWVSLNAAAMQTIAVAVGTWVQACYSAYRAISDQIAAGTITTPDQIDAAFAAVTLPG